MARIQGNLVFNNKIKTKINKNHPEVEKQSSKQASKQAGRQAGRQAGKQAGRQAGRELFAQST